jgi:Lar family restriction alleviation protein
MTEELKNCPFCDGVEPEIDDQTNLYWVSCWHCSTEGPAKESRQEAIEAWNTRAAPSQPEGAEDRRDDRKRLAILASFAHEVLMGAIRPKAQADAAKHVLQLTRLMMLDDVCALNEPAAGAAAPDEGMVLEGYLLWDGDDPEGHKECIFCGAEGGDPAHKPGESDHRKHVWVSKKLYSIDASLSAPKGEEPS